MLFRCEEPGSDFADLREPVWEDGRAYEWAVCGRYAPTRLDWAIERALCNWWLLAGGEAEDRDAIHKAVLRAQESQREAA